MLFEHIGLWPELSVYTLFFGVCRSPYCTVAQARCSRDLFTRLLLLCSGLWPLLCGSACMCALMHCMQCVCSLCGIAHDARAWHCMRGVVGALSAILLLLLPLITFVMAVCGSDAQTATVCLPARHITQASSVWWGLCHITSCSSNVTSCQGAESTLSHVMLFQRFFDVCVYVRLAACQLLRFEQSVSVHKLHCAAAGLKFH
jgi:hypothetical protein